MQHAQTRREIEQLALDAALLLTRIVPHEPCGGTSLPTRNSKRIWTSATWPSFSQTS